MKTWPTNCEIVIFYLVHARAQNALLMFAINVQAANKTDHLFYV